MSDLHPTSGYTHTEEWANFITHGIRVTLSIAGLVVAVVLAACIIQWASSSTSGTHCSINMQSVTSSSWPVSPVSFLRCCH
jgi:predicted membrane channel-forming protein YqfA (hemolysin III family)